MTQAVKDLTDRGIQARIVETEVVYEDNPDLEFVNKLLINANATLHTAQVRTTKIYLPLWRRRTRRLLQDVDLFNTASLDTLLGQLEAEVIALIDESNASVRDNVHNRLRTFCTMHLIPRLHKETQ